MSKTSQGSILPKEWGSTVSSCIWNASQVSSNLLDILPNMRSSPSQSRPPVNIPTFHLNTPFNYFQSQPCAAPEFCKHHTCSLQNMCPVHLPNQNTRQCWNICGVPCPSDIAPMQAPQKICPCLCCPMVPPCTPPPQKQRLTVCTPPGGMLRVSSAGDNAQVECSCKNKRIPKKFKSPQPTSTAAKCTLECHDVCVAENNKLRVKKKTGKKIMKKCKSDAQLIKKCSPCLCSCVVETESRKKLAAFPPPCTCKKLVKCPSKRMKRCVAECFQQTTYEMCQTEESGEESHLRSDCSQQSRECPRIRRKKKKCAISKSREQSCQSSFREQYNTSPCSKSSQVLEISIQQAVSPPQCKKRSRIKESCRNKTQSCVKTPSESTLMKKESVQSQSISCQYPEHADEDLVYEEPSEKCLCPMSKKENISTQTGSFYTRDGEAALSTTEMATGPCPRDCRIVRKLRKKKQMLSTPTETTRHDDEFERQYVSKGCTKVCSPSRKYSPENVGVHQCTSTTRCCQCNSADMDENLQQIINQRLEELNRKETTPPPNYVCQKRYSREAQTSPTHSFHNFARKCDVQDGIISPRSPEFSPDTEITGGVGNCFQTCNSDCQPLGKVYSMQSFKNSARRLEAIAEESTQSRPSKTCTRRSITIDPVDDTCAQECNSFDLMHRQEDNPTIQDKSSSTRELMPENEGNNCGYATPIIKKSSPIRMYGREISDRGCGESTLATGESILRNLCSRKETCNKFTDLASQSKPSSPINEIRPEPRIQQNEISPLGICCRKSDEKCGSVLKASPQVGPIYGTNDNSRSFITTHSHTNIPTVRSSDYTQEVRIPKKKRSRNCECLSDDVKLTTISKNNREGIMYPSASQDISSNSCSCTSVSRGCGSGRVSMRSERKMNKTNSGNSVRTFQHTDQNLPHLGMSKDVSEEIDSINYQEMHSNTISGDFHQDPIDSVCKEISGSKTKCNYTPHKSILSSEYNRNRNDPCQIHNARSPNRNGRIETETTVLQPQRRDSVNHEHESINVKNNDLTHSCKSGIKGHCTQPSPRRKISDELFATHRSRSRIKQGLKKNEGDSFVIERKVCASSCPNKNKGYEHGKFDTTDSLCCIKVSRRGKVPKEPTTGSPPVNGAGQIHNKNVQAQNCASNGVKSRINGDNVNIARGRGKCNSVDGIDKRRPDDKSGFKNPQKTQSRECRCSSERKRNNENSSCRCNRRRSLSKIKKLRKSTSETATQKTNQVNGDGVDPQNVEKRHEQSHKCCSHGLEPTDVAAENVITAGQQLELSADNRIQQFNTNGYVSHDLHQGWIDARRGSEQTNRAGIESTNINVQNVHHGQSHDSARGHNSLSLIKEYRPGNESMNLDNTQQPVHGCCQKSSERIQSYGGQNTSEIPSVIPVFRRRVRASPEPQRSANVYRYEIEHGKDDSRFLSLDYSKLYQNKTQENLSTGINKRQFSSQSREYLSPPNSHNWNPTLRPPTLSYCQNNPERIFACGLKTNEVNCQTTENTFIRKNENNEQYPHRREFYSLGNETRDDLNHSPAEFSRKQSSIVDFTYSKVQNRFLNRSGLDRILNHGREDINGFPSKLTNEPNPPGNKYLGEVDVKCLSPTTKCYLPSREIATRNYSEFDVKSSRLNRPKSFQPDFHEWETLNSLDIKSRSSIPNLKDGESEMRPSSAAGSTVLSTPLIPIDRSGPKVNTALLLKNSTTYTTGEKSVDSKLQGLPNVNQVSRGVFNNLEIQPSTIAYSQINDSGNNTSTMDTNDRSCIPKTRCTSPDVLRNTHAYYHGSTNHDIASMSLGSNVQNTFAGSYSGVGAHKMEFHNHSIGSKHKDDSVNKGNIHINDHSCVPIKNCNCEREQCNAIQNPIDPGNVQEIRNYNNNFKSQHQPIGSDCSDYRVNRYNVSTVYKSCHEDCTPEQDSHNAFKKPTVGCGQETTNCNDLLKTLDGGVHLTIDSNSKVKEQSAVNSRNICDTHSIRSKNNMEKSNGNQALSPTRIGSRGCGSSNEPNQRTLNYCEHETINNEPRFAVNVGMRDRASINEVEPLQYQPKLRNDLERTCESKNEVPHQIVQCKQGRKRTHGLENHTQETNKYINISENKQDNTVQSRSCSREIPTRMCKRDGVINSHHLGGNPNDAPRPNQVYSREKDSTEICNPRQRGIVNSRERESIDKSDSNYPILPCICRSPRSKTVCGQEESINSPQCTHNICTFDRTSPEKINSTPYNKRTSEVDAVEFLPSNKDCTTRIRTNAEREKHRTHRSLTRERKLSPSKASNYSLCCESVCGRGTRDRQITQCPQSPHSRDKYRSRRYQRCHKHKEDLVDERDESESRSLTEGQHKKISLNCVEDDKTRKQHQSEHESRIDKYYNQYQSNERRRREKYSTLIQKWNKTPNIFACSRCSESVMRPVMKPISASSTSTILSGSGITFEISSKKDPSQKTYSNLCDCTQFHSQKILYELPISLPEKCDHHEHISNQYAARYGVALKQDDIERSKRSIKNERSFRHLGSKTKPCAKSLSNESGKPRGMANRPDLRRRERRRTRECETVPSRKYLQNNDSVPSNYSLVDYASSGHMHSRSSEQFIRDFVNNPDSFQGQICRAISRVIYQALCKPDTYKAWKSALEPLPMNSEQKRAIGEKSFRTSSREDAISEPERDSCLLKLTLRKEKKKCAELETKSNVTDGLSNTYTVGSSNIRDGESNLLKMLNKSSSTRPNMKELDVEVKKVESLSTTSTETLKGSPVQSSSDLCSGRTKENANSNNVTDMSTWGNIASHSSIVKVTEIRKKTIQSMPGVRGKLMRGRSSYEQKKCMDEILPKVKNYSSKDRECCRSNISKTCSAFQRISRVSKLREDSGNTSGSVEANTTTSQTSILNKYENHLYSLSSLSSLTTDSPSALCPYNFLGKTIQLSCSPIVQVNKPPEGYESSFEENTPSDISPEVHMNKNDVTESSSSSRDGREKLMRRELRKRTSETGQMTSSQRLCDGDISATNTIRQKVNDISKTGENKVPMTVPLCVCKGEPISLCSCEGTVFNTTSPENTGAKIGVHPITSKHSEQKPYRSDSYVAGIEKFKKSIEPINSSEFVKRRSRSNSGVSYANECITKSSKLPDSVISRCSCNI